MASREPFEEAPAHLKGVVTWVDKTAGKKFYVQDETGGVLVEFEGDLWPSLTESVEVTGLITRGDFAPQVIRASFSSLGQGSQPPPIVWPNEGLLNGVQNGKLVVVGGWVRSAAMLSPTTLELSMNFGASRIHVEISNAVRLDPETLIGCNVLVTGVANPVKARGASSELIKAQTLAAIDNPKEIPMFIRELMEVTVLVASPNFLQNISQKNHFARVPGASVPLEKVFRYRPGQHRDGRVRVRGQVIYIEDGVIYISNGKVGIAMRCTGPITVHRGDWVNAAGFPDIERSLPILSNAVILSSAPAEKPVQPKPLSAFEKLDASLHAQYVAVTGRLLDRMQSSRQNLGRPGDDNRKATLLALQLPQGVLTAEVESDGIAQLPREAEVGSILQVQGVCVMHPEASGDAASFGFRVPSPDNVSVVERTSIFTVKRLLILLTILFAVLLGVTLLAYVFSRRNLRLMTEVRERQAVIAERQRFARDLHDTLEQGLTGIQFRLQSIGSSPEEASPETQECLDAVRTLVDQCHAETRRSIWNLRSAAPEHIDLGEALERTARSLALGSNVEIRFKQQRSPVTIPPLIENNFLRIGQEAIMNAIKHAHPRVLEIEVAVTPACATLTVRDDGRGNTGPHERPGHFGLTGMRERADRIGGELTITSDPAKGCTVHISVPLQQTHTEALVS